MNMYVNLCPAYTEKSETLTLDVPPDLMDSLMQYVHVLSEEKNNPPPFPHLARPFSFTIFFKYTICSIWIIFHQMI